MDRLHRHKRSFTEMSQSTTLSPSPHNFGDAANPHFFHPQRSSYAASSNNHSQNLDSFLERRRTPHPHNNYSLGSQDMSEHSQSQQQRRRSGLDDGASQTVIDLTDEPEEAAAMGQESERPSRVRRPPHLGRSDAMMIGDLIDLTEDNDEPEVVITGERVNSRPPRPPPPARAGSIRLPSPGLFMPLPMDNGAAQRLLGGAAQAGFNFFAHFHRGSGIAHGALENLLDHFPVFNGPNAAVLGAQPMPVGMDYAHGAFEHRKPEHVPPPPARDNFTRSPTENDTVICPSCEQELVHNKEDEEVVVKKNSKQPSKKDREEHPFWVVKQCGHVFCNYCFQHRSEAHKFDMVSFREGPSKNPNKNPSRKSNPLLCSVEDCESDVKGKDKWIGVFL